MTNAPQANAAAPTGLRAPCRPRWLWLAPVGPLLLLGVDAALEPAARLALLARLLYLTPPLALSLFAVAAARRWRAAAVPWRSAVALWPGLVVAALLVLAVLSASPPAMRMQFDESSLVAVSQGMHAERAATMATGALPFDGGSLRLESTVDKRPPLFAFLVSVAHDLVGPRIENAFAVNALLLGVGFVLLFAAARAWRGLAAGLAAPVLVTAVPLSALVATSAGFELLAVVLFVGVLWAAVDVVQQARRGPVPEPSSWLLLALGCLFAQARYESLPAAALVFALVAFAVRGRVRWTRGLVGMAIAAVWLAGPVVVQLVYAQNPDFYPEAAGRPLVAVAHLLAHAPPFAQQWFAPALQNPLPGVLAIAGALAYAVRLARRRAGFLDLVVLLPVAAVTGAALLWFYGDVREATALRLFVPAAWACALLPLVALPHLPRRAGWLLLAAAVVLAGLRLNAVARGETMPPLRNAELAEAMVRAAGEVDGDDTAHTLWVAVTAQHLIVHGRSALPPRSFAARVREVQQAVRDGHVRRIFVLTTPLDLEFAPAYGDPQDVLRATGAEFVRRFDGDLPLSVYRVRLR